ncbi:hypothetical protein EPUS_03873 [Endocarpon pusillum Z07020]|uniref:BTB domain-containing protein n=1 Tax=Endocarpon pusillum (strain Z07020 / HMAS-L-300199) TaxID=1263415 RepID=U1GP30_ENDPU|nr:uncharacterized protein EPUS_03873 [Endocarpon pusillum Z07020]ERF74058.1 hypothetical protein EPUS_03873 [Endocarpon pusillum Z07020]
MASELSESSSSPDILTPAVSVDEQRDHVATTAHGLGDGVTAVQDDMALGMELMIKKMQIQSGVESTENAQPSRETIVGVIGENLQSEICTISVGEEKVNFNAHLAILKQSPVLATLLKHKQKPNKPLRIVFPNQSPPIIRGILQYLYGQELSQRTSDTAQQVEELCETYTIAGDLKLDILQGVIIDSLDSNTEPDMSKDFLCAAEKVYKKCAARWPFREFFKRKIKEEIRKEGLDDSSHLYYAFEDLVAAGGELAIDIAKVLMEVCTERIEICPDKLPNARAQYAESELALMYTTNDVLRAKIAAADVRSKDIEKAFEAAQKNAASNVEVAGNIARAAQHQRESAETALENERARADSAEARLHELSERALAAEQRLESLKKASSGQQDMSNIRDQAKNQEAQATKTTGPRTSRWRSLQDVWGQMEDEGVVAIASKSQSSPFPGCLAFEQGDLITNIGIWDNQWVGSCHGNRGYFQLDCVENPEMLEGRFRW